MLFYNIQPSWLHSIEGIATNYIYFKTKIIFCVDMLSYKTVNRKLRIIDSLSFLVELLPESIQNLVVLIKHKIILCIF